MATLNTALIFSIFFFVPPMLYVAFSLPSMSAGIAISVVASLVLLHRTLRHIKINDLNSKALPLLLLASITHIAIFSFIEISEKKIISLLILLLMIASAALFSNHIKRLRDTELRLTLTTLGLIFISLGFLSIAFKFPYLNYDLYTKPVFPFSEPSHYATSISSILIFIGLFANDHKRIILIIITALMGLALPSTMLLIISMIMILIYYAASLNLKNAIIIILLMAAALSLASSTSPDFSYFMERIIFSQASQNLSSLVYMQGWEIAIDTTTEKFGLGLGFQNMEKSQVGTYGQIIYSLLGEHRNRSEGSFTASKLISEFGLIGIIITLLYIKQLINSARSLIKFNYHLDNHTPVYLIFSHCSIVAFSIEMFGRGTGYFSMGVFLTFVAMFSLLSKRQQAKAAQ